jgi:alanine racemase
MKKSERLGLRTWIEIDKKAIKHNYSVFRSLISKETKIMAVVKSNAYGHNLTEFAQEQEKLGVDYLAVDSAVEGIALRKFGIKIPILVLGYTLPEMISEAVENDLEITVSNFDYFKEIRKLNLNKSVKIHIKVDTGMHRHGFQITDIKKVIAEIKKTKVTVVGLYTHFAMAKNPSFPAYTKSQIEKFNIWREAFALANLKSLCHAGATAGALLYEEAHFDMVRIGISLYGIWPSKEAEAFCEGKIKLQPVLSWKTIVAEVKQMPKGTKIGYDCSETLEKDSIVAILPVGYWHGFPRAISSIGYVLVSGQRCKILGRICMDIIIIDVTAVKNPKIGDEVTIIGQDEKENISVDDIAHLISMSSYELVTRINPLIKRVFK